MAAVQDIRDDQFSTAVLGSKTPVVVKFHAEYWGGCTVVAPVLESLAKQYQAKVKVVAIDVATYDNAAAEFGITAIPTMIAFKDGREVGRYTGAKTDKVTQLFEALAK